jgi:hypothetical protein
VNDHLYVGFHVAELEEPSVFCGDHRLTAGGLILEALSEAYVLRQVAAASPGIVAVRQAKLEL